MSAPEQVAGDLVTLTIATPAVGNGQLVLLAAAKKLEIADPETAQLAADLRKEIVSGKKAITDLYAGPKRALDEAKRTVLDRERVDVAPYEEALGIITTKIITYDDKLDLERRRAEKAARDEAERLERERQAEIVRQEEARASQVQQLALEGKTEEDERVAAEPIEEPPPVAAPAAVIPIKAPAPKGLSIPKKKKARVDNFPAFVEWCLKTGNTTTFLEPVLPPLNAWAVRAKALTDAPPGVVFYDEKHLRGV